MPHLLPGHLARYYFAADFLHGRVLDFANGSGYGTHLAAKLAKERVWDVIGIDSANEAVAYAKRHYYHPLTTFLTGDVTNPKLPEQLGQFDCILSFETIEHVRKEALFLQNIGRLLKPAGLLILSIPFGNGKGKLCRQPFHAHQLTVTEFKQLFAAYEDVSFYYQKGPLIEPAAIAKSNIHWVSRFAGKERQNRKS